MREMCGRQPGRVWLTCASRLTGTPGSAGSQPTTRCLGFRAGYVAHLGRGMTFGRTALPVGARGSVNCFDEHRARLLFETRSVAGRVFPDDLLLPHGRAPFEGARLTNHPHSDNGTGSVPQNEGPDKTHHADEGEDPSDHVDVDTRHMHVDRQSQNEAERD